MFVLCTRNGRLGLPVQHPDPPPLFFFFFLSLPTENLNPLTPLLYLLHTKVMLSSYHGHAPLVRLLLAHGADPNGLNDRGQSPLAGAVFKNEREVVQALLDGDADPRVGAPSALEAVKVCLFIE